MIHGGGKDLRRTCRGEDSGSWFVNNLDWSIGNGNNIKFWYEKFLESYRVKLLLSALLLGDNC